MQFISENIQKCTAKIQLIFYITKLYSNFFSKNFHYESSYIR